GECTRLACGARRTLEPVGRAARQRHVRAEALAGRACDPGDGVLGLPAELHDVREPVAVDVPEPTQRLLVRAKALCPRLRHVARAYAAGIHPHGSLIRVAAERDQIGDAVTGHVASRAKLLRAAKA